MIAKCVQLICLVSQEYTDILEKLHFGEIKDGLSSNTPDVIDLQ